MIFVVSCSLVFASNNVNDFVKKLSPQQKSLVEEFLYTLVDSPAGYVIYGEKPMSILSMEISPLGFLSEKDRPTLALAKGMEFWNELKLITDNKEILLFTCEHEQTTSLICINQRVFLQKIEENLPLFRYVLGPLVTPKTLLGTFIRAKNPVQQVLKNNKALLNMLLGTGRQNAICYARMLEISDASRLDPIEEFPLTAKHLRKSNSQIASFGFSSMDEEAKLLNNRMEPSEKITSFCYCDIPHFHCDKSLSETKALFKNYEQARNRMIAVLGSKQFLEDSLRKLLITNSRSLHIPQVPKEKELVLESENNQEEIAHKLVELVKQQIASHAVTSEKAAHSFMQGVIAREKGKRMPDALKRDIIGIQREYECCKRLEQANAYFQNLDARRDVTCVIPGEIYYKILKTGNEGIVSSKTQAVSFQYSVQMLGENPTKDWGVVKRQAVSDLIPGIGHAIQGMQLGEERVIYIHPKFAYGEETKIPNTTFVLQMRLLDFQDGACNVTLCPPLELEQRDFNEIALKLEVLQAEKVFDEGVAFWDSIKKQGTLIDFDTFEKVFNKNEN